MNKPRTGAGASSQIPKNPSERVIGGFEARAHVGAWLDDSAGALLYRAAGFQLIDRFYEWHKTYPSDAQGAA